MLRSFMKRFTVRCFNNSGLIQDSVAERAGKDTASATWSSQNQINAHKKRLALLALNTLPRRRCSAAAFETRSRFQPQELQILISAEQEAKTRFTAHRVTVGLVTNLIIRVWGYNIIIIMSTVFLHVTAIKNKLQLISSRASC